MKGWGRFSVIYLKYHQKKVNSKKIDKKVKKIERELGKMFCNF